MPNKFSQGKKLRQAHRDLEKAINRLERTHARLEQTAHEMEREVKSARKRLDKAWAQFPPTARSLGYEDASKLNPLNPGLKFEEPSVLL
jgi:chromosome segregation ATPase